MNAQPKRSALQPPALRPSLMRRVLDAALGKFVTLALASTALVLVVGTFVVLSGGVPLTRRPNLIYAMVLSNLVVLLLLGAVLAGRLTRVWVERRRGSAGSRLHVRLVMMLSVVSVTPTIVLAVMATAFFNLGIQSWFNDRVRTALNEGLEASRGYLEEHRNNIRGDAASMAITLSAMGPTLRSDPFTFSQELQTQTVLRGLTEAILFDPATNEIAAGIGAVEGEGVEPPSYEETERARGARSLCSGHRTRTACAPWCSST